MIQRKVHRVKLRVNDANYKHTCMLHTWSCSTISHLSMVLQRLDDCGGILWDVCLEHSSLFRKAISSFSSVATLPISQGDLASLFWYVTYRWEHIGEEDTGSQIAAMLVVWNRCASHVCLPRSTGSINNAYMSFAKHDYVQCRHQCQR
jgi:hypothetical protein